MHGIIGQLVHDPVRLAIAILALIAVIAITRCLSGLALFRGATPRRRIGSWSESPATRSAGTEVAGSAPTHSSTSAED